MASTSLQDFVKEQKTKTHSPSVQSLASFQSGFTDFRSKLSSSLSSFELPLIGRSKNDVAVDFETSSTNGQLPASQNRKNAQSGWMGGLLTSDDAFGLTRTQRVLGFFMCLLSGVFCFGLATLFLPVVVLQARKFAALNTLGSCFLIFSFALLWGPRSYIAHLFSSPRIPVTASYFVSVLGTLYCALWIRNSLLTLVCSAVQFVCLIWFVLSYVPGGERGLRFITSIFTRVVKTQSKTVLPI